MNPDVYEKAVNWVFDTELPPPIDKEELQAGTEYSGFPSSATSPGMERTRWIVAISPWHKDAVGGRLKHHSPF